MVRERIHWPTSQVSHRQFHKDCSFCLHKADDLAWDISFIRMEPITIFGLSLAILNIFLNTITSIYDKTDQILTYKEKLKRLHRTLQDCSISFKLWRAIWEREGATEKTYRDLFSKDGWGAIKSSKAFIEHHLEALRGELCLVVKPLQSADTSPGVQFQDLGGSSSATKRMRENVLGIYRRAMRKKAVATPSGGASIAETAMGEIPKGLQPW